MPKADNKALYSFTKPASCGCDASKFSTEYLSLRRGFLIDSGLRSARVASWAEASTRRAMLRASS